VDISLALLCFFLETAEHFMCCANTCEVLKAIHILEIYVWKNSRNTKNEVCRRHALQLSYPFIQIDSKTVIVPIVLLMLGLLVYIKVLGNNALRTTHGHKKRKGKNSNKWVQSVFFTSIRYHLLMRTSVACTAKKSLAIILRVSKFIYFPEPGFQNNSYLRFI
jgi:hypothetical protein